MSNLKFVETHNLVAFLEKPKESDGFEGIIDFLNASFIRYALTMNPTINTSCIKQFLATAKAKTVNREVQIQALVDRKKAIVTETSVRRALRLKDVEGTECLPNATIFAELERIGAKTTAWNEFSSTMASAIIYEQEVEVEKMQDYEPAAILQSKIRILTIEKRSKMFVELMDKRKKHFARLRAEEKRRKPPTKAQKRSQMSTYLKHMAGYKQNQLKSKNYDEIQKLFDKAMTRVNMFVDMDIELVKESSKKAKMIQESSSKRAGEELESDNSKKQKLDENVEAENIDREDLETLWKLVKAKHGNTRPEEAYERVLWGDLKVMFEPDIESEVWRNLQGYKVTIWKLFSSSGVHFVRFQNLHIFMLVEKKYPLTPATITAMLNKKLQADHWNEMCYQLLKLMTKQLKNPGSV
ncbi:hypothetical protein Tco_1011215 [Tanacetum coccineum]